MAAAFCRRRLLDDRSVDVFLVDGIVGVDGIDARVASRPKRRASVRLEYGNLLSIVREAEGAGVLVERAEVIDHQLADSGVALWLRAEVNGFVRWQIPATLPIRPSELSLHVAQLANDPFDLSTSADYEDVRDALNAGQISPALATAFLDFHVEVDLAVDVITRSSRQWTIQCRTGRKYLLNAVVVTHDRNGTPAMKFTAACDPPTNQPIGERRFAVELADRSGRKSRIELRAAPPMAAAGDRGRVAAHSGFRVPLSAFDVDAAELASVAIVALEPCELAITHVELVASWD